MTTEKIPICPGTFCFNFLSAGNKWAPVVYPDLQTAMSYMIDVYQDQCGSCMPCRRSTRILSDKDFYEPHEPNLDKAGLDYNHFIDAG